MIITATALGSGELILWPYLTTLVGVRIVWLSVLGITMQYFLNMEIERYTLISSETAVTGFSRLWVGWGIVFILTSISIHKDRDLPQHSADLEYPVWMHIHS